MTHLHNDFEQAKQLINQAEERRSTNPGFLATMYGIQKGNVEEAVKLYGQGANILKNIRQWKAAGDAFYAAATSLQWLDKKMEAATMFIDAGNCYKKVNALEAIDSMKTGVNIIISMGDLLTAAKHYTTIAHIYEKNLEDIDKAMVHYELAGRNFQAVKEFTSEANECLLKVADHYAIKERYDKAIDIYEEIRAHTEENRLRQYGAKKYMLKILLCQMCVDLLIALQTLEKYAAESPTFRYSRQFKLVKILLNSLEERNVAAFQKVVDEYNSVLSLDQWSATMISRIGTNFPAQ